MNIATPTASTVAPSVYRTLVRSMVSHVLAAERKTDVATAARNAYPSFPEVTLAALNPQGWYRNAISKAVTQPAMSNVSGWAAELASAKRSAGVVAGLTSPVSAYSRLASRGTALDFTGVGSVAVPGRAPGAVANFFVAEGAPISVVALSFAGSALPYKGGIVSYFSGTLARHSTPNIEEVVKQQLAIDGALSIDAAMISANAVSASAPAGLLAGVTETPHAATGTPTEKFAADIGALAAAIAMPLDLVFLVSASDWPRVVTYSPGLADRLIMSPAQAAKTLIAVDAAYFYAMEDPETFQIDVSKDATLITSDAPVPYVDAAGTLGKPVQNALQADLVCVRLIADIAFGMSRAGRVSWTSSVSW